MSSRTAARARRGFVLSRTCCHPTAGLLGRRSRSLGAPLAMTRAAHTATGMHALVLLLLLLLAQSMCAVQAGVYTCVHSHNGTWSTVQPYARRFQECEVFVFCFSFRGLLI